MKVPMSMDNIELRRYLANAVAGGDLPFVSVMVGDHRGVQWSMAAGNAGPDRPCDEATVFRLFSMTKAIGAVAAMVLIERGVLRLDDPVAKHVPEFAGLGVLQVSDKGVVGFRNPSQPVNVKHLLTHTSGLAYEFWSPKVLNFLQAEQRPGVLAGSHSAMAYPLVCDPGEQWNYGIGLDWIGRIIEAVDGRSVDRFVTEEVLQPLAMSDTVFELDSLLRTRLATVHMRGEAGLLEPVTFDPPEHPEIYGLGHALYGTANDYFRFLRMVLNRGRLDGQRVLSEASVKSMLDNHIGDLPVPVLRSAVPPLTGDLDLLPGTRKSQGLAFLRFEEGATGMRGPGSHGWAGALNTHYWIDPERDLAAIFMTQMLPFLDTRVMRVFDRFERAVYAS